MTAVPFLRAPLLLVLVLGLGLSGVACGGSDSPPEGIDDPGAVDVGADVPAWFPTEVRPPAGSVVVEVIDDPVPTFGRSVTWRVEPGFEDVVDHVDSLLASLGWTTTEETETDGDAGSRRRTYFIDNDAVFSIRIFEDESLEGVRFAVELPAAQ